MNDNISFVALSDIATPISRPVTVTPGVVYRTLGVKWWGGGAYEREAIDGSQTAAKTLSIVNKDDLIINKIWVRHGSTAIVDERVDGCAASGEFPTFALNPDKVLSRWIHWLTKTGKFWECCDRLSRGTSGKNRIRPDQFLTIQIPLPPLAEQRRVVARIEELAAKIEEARVLRREAADELETMHRSITSTTLKSIHYEPQSLKNLVRVSGGGTPSKSNPLYWQGNIPWISPKDMKQREIHDAIDHISEEATRITSARIHDPGSVLIVTRGMILAHTVPSAVLRVPAAINQDMKALYPKPNLMPEYLCSALSAFNTEILQLVERSTHDTRKLETPKLLDFAIPVPPIKEQQQIVAYFNQIQAKADSLRQMQGETAAELDALLPTVLDRAFQGKL